MVFKGNGTQTCYQVFQKFNRKKYYTIYIHNLGVMHIYIYIRKKIITFLKSIGSLQKWFKTGFATPFSF